MHKIAHKRMTTGRPRRGMSLIEVLIGLVIMSMLMAALLSFFAKGQQDFFRGNVRSDVLDKARYPLGWIGRDANVARLIGLNSHGSFTSSSVLIICLPCLDANGYVITDTGQYDDVIYSVANNRLTRVCYPNIGQTYREGGTKVLADNVAGLVLTYYDSDNNVLTSGYTAAVAVKAEVTVSTNVGSRNFRQALSSRFTLRNKS